MLIVKIINNKQISPIVIYVVLTYFFAFVLSLDAMDSASLFLKPFPNPMSKKAIQEIIVVIVNQIPYRSWFRLFINKGT